MLPQLFFGYFAFVIVGTSLLVVTRKNPVHSVLWMLLLFFHISALYIFLNAEFLAAIQIIIYAGAILVLFLFVIMLLNIRDEEKKTRFHKIWPLGFIFSIGMTSFMVYIVKNARILIPGGNYSIQTIEKEGNTMIIGRVLYTEYLFPFEIASIVLLVAIIGAIILAKKKLN